LSCIDEALIEGDFLGAGDLESLSLLERPDELGRLDQAVVSSQA
jgi:hypothetical protein